MNMLTVWFVTWWWISSRNTKNWMLNWNVRSLLLLSVTNFRLVLSRWLKYILLRNVRSVSVIKWQVATVTRVSCHVLYVRKICRSWLTVLRLISYWIRWACLLVWTSDRFLKLCLDVPERHWAWNSQLLFSMVLQWKIWTNGQTKLDCLVTVKLIFVMAVQVSSLTRQLP